MLKKGLLLVVVSIVAGFALEGGNILILFQPFGALIICGAAFGSFIISNPRDLLQDIRHSLRNLGKTRPYDRQDYLELLAFQFNFFRTVRQLSLTEIEQHIDEPLGSPLFKRFPGMLNNTEAISFFCDQMRMLIMGFDNVYELETMMDTIINNKRTKIEETSNALYKMGDSLPAIGIIAAVLGVINAMGSISSEPEILGQKIASALIGTILGIFLAYGVVMPISAFISKYGNDELYFFESMKTGILTHARGHVPLIALEFARQTIPDNYKPTFAEIENLIDKQNKIIPYKYARQTKR